jgi:hypothetical protein
MEVRNEDFYRFITQAKEIGKARLRMSKQTTAVEKPINNVGVMNLEE